MKILLEIKMYYCTLHFAAQYIRIIEWALHALQINTFLDVESYM